MKAVGLFLLVVSGGMIGCSRAAALYKRAKSLETAHRLVRWLMQQLRYTAAPLGELLREAAQTQEFSSLSALLSSEKDMEYMPFSYAWKKAVIKSEKGCSFTEEDVQVLCRFGEGLGKTDLEGQLAHSAQYAGLLEERQEEAQRIAREKGRMICLLWLAGTAILALLLI